MKKGLVAGVAVVYISLVFVVPSVDADVKDDFKAALDSDGGCDNIPYSQERSRCKDIGRDAVNYWCKVEERSCSEGLFTEKMAANVEEMTRQISSLESQKSQNNDNESKEKNKNLETNITRLKQISENNKKEIENRKYEIKKRIENGQRCLDNRLAVINLYKVALDKIKSESDPEAKTLAPALIKKIEPTIPKHETEASEVSSKLEDCKKIR
jgi:hypothetical protein